MAWCANLTKVTELIILLSVLATSSSGAFSSVKSVLQRSDRTRSLGFSLIHRDAPRSPLRAHVSDLEQLSDQNPLKDVIRHVQAQQVRIKNSRHRRQHHHLRHHRRGHHDRVSGIHNPVVTLGQAGLEYYMPLQIGTPPTEVILIMDTGSDVSWIQCVPCNDCVQAFRPPFNPRHSSSFFRLPCMSPTCKTVYQGVKPFCSASGKTCLFSVGYADGSLSSGLLALETISANATKESGSVAKVANVTFGCANIDREGVPTGASGLLGMDRRPISFPSQMSSRYGEKFAHCFPDKITHLNSSGVIFFGESAITPQLNYTPFIENKAIPGASLDYYYIGLVGISVNKLRLPIAETNFEIQSTGGGGTIIDSGTVFTSLRTPVFEAMRRQFLKRASRLRRVSEKFGLSPCYNVSNGGLESARVPSITLHFQDGLDVTLPKNSVLIPVSGDSEQTTFCLAFQTSSTVPFNIIGNYQQQDLWIEYDLKKLQLGIASLQCATD